MIGSIDWTQRLQSDTPASPKSEDGEGAPAWSRGLKTIDLSYNDITAKGALGLLTALQKNKSIVDVNLAGNDIATVRSRIKFASRSKLKKQTRAFWLGSPSNL